MTAKLTGTIALLALFVACSSSSDDKAKKQRAEQRGLGARLVFALEVPPNLASSRDELLDQVLETVRRRVDQLGLREPSVSKRDGRIVVEFLDASLDQVQQTEHTVAERSSLRFRLAVHEHPGMMALCRALEREDTDASPAVSARYDTWRAGDDDRPFTDCYLEATDRAALEAHVRAHASELALGSDQTMVYEQLPPADGKQASTWRTHVINRTSVLTGAHVANAYVTSNPSANAPEVRLEFDEVGSGLFALITRENVGSKLIMTLDDRVLSAPVIRDEVTGGASVISLGAVEPARAQREAEELVLAIRSGSLPAPLRLESAIGF